MHRKIIGLLTTFVLCTSSLMATPLPDLMSDGAMLIEPTTNTIIYSKNGQQTFYPASTTKVLTSLLLVEDLQLDTLITKTKDAIQNVPSDSSHIGLLAGDTYTAFDGLHAIMMASDNFVSYDMAVKDAGSIESFADKMNEKAKSLGATSSHFVNPHGYHNEAHYTTPFDLSQIARGAFRNPILAEIAGTKTYDFHVKNRDMLIPMKHTALLYDANSTYYNEHVSSAKTGYHTPAKRTLVAKATYDNIDLIAVVMRADAPYQFEDINKLFEYGAKNFSFEVSEAGTPYVSNHSYSSWAAPYINAALEQGWITPSTTNYMSSIPKKEFIDLLASSLPQYQSTLLSTASSSSIYLHNKALTKAELSVLSYDLLDQLGLTEIALSQPTIADIMDLPLDTQKAISFLVSANLLSLDESGNSNPQGTVSYEQAIKMIYNLNKIVTRYTTFTYIPTKA